MPVRDLRAEANSRGPRVRGGSAAPRACILGGVGEDERAGAEWPAETCVACSAALVGAYCHVCGESRFRGPLRLRAVLHDVLYAALSLEGGFARTLAGLVLAPGRTIEEYTRGIRRVHCSPVRFFLWMLVVVVAGNAFLDWVAPVDFTDPGLGMYPEWWFDRATSLPGWEKLSDPASLERSYRDMQRMMRVNAAVQPVAFSLAAWLVFLDKRRTYAEHLCFSLYAFGVTVVLTLLQSVFLRFGPWWDFWLTLPLPYLYLAWAAGQFHRIPIGLAVLRTFAAGVLMMCVVSPFYAALAVWSMTRDGG